MYFPVLLWSLLILVSFWGYGEALRRWLKRPEYADIGWGLTMAWGMAVTLALGGVLMALHLAQAPILTALVLLGALLALALTLLPSPKPAAKGKGAKPEVETPALPPHRFQGAPAGLILWGLAGLLFATSIAWPNQIDPNDDLICYLMLPERILQTGSLIEPFNLRRMGTLGGHSLLQALTMIVGWERSGHVADSGLGFLIWFGLLYGMLGRAAGHVRWLAILVLLAAIFIPVPRINTMSSMTGMAMLLGLYMTFWHCGKTVPASWRALVPIALLVAAAATLRPTYLLAAGGFTALFMTWTALETPTRPPGKPDTRFFSPLFTGALALALLAPWMFVLWQSNGTPHYPPFPGNINPPFEDVGSKQGPIVDAANALSFMFSAEVVVLLVSGILIPMLPGQRLAWSVFATTLFCTWLIAFKFGVTIHPEFYRYTFPGLAAMAFFFLAWALLPEGQQAAEAEVRAAKIAAPGLALLMIVIANLAPGARELQARIASLPLQFALREPLLKPEIGEAYQKLQSLVPEGEPVLAVVDAPYLLNYRRNTIYNVDAIGGASPWGGMPFFKGPSALASYLLKNGVRYILTVDFDNALLLYTRKHWREHHRPEWFFKEVWGKHALDFMDNVDSLAASNRVLGTAANVRLIELIPRP